MTEKNVVFLGAKEIGYFCLNHLLENKQQLNVNVLGVLVNKNRTNEKYNFQKLCSDYKVRVLDSLEDLMLLPKIDFIISVQYHEILKKKHIDQAKEIAVNLHMASLPEYRGCNQFSFAILDKKKEFGTTLHEMKPGVDNGDILFEKRFSIPEGVFVEKLVEMTDKIDNMLGDYSW